MSDEQTALTVIPKNELAVVAKKAEVKADKLGKIANRVAIGALSGGVTTAIGALVALHFAPVVVPVLTITMLASFFGGIPASIAIDSKGSKARRRQTEALRQGAKAVRKRGELLAATARTALEGAIEDGTIRIGLDLRIEPQDETPKKVHVEDVSATVRGKGEKKLSISARILEEDGTRIDWLGLSASAVSLEQPVAAFPKAVLESMRDEAPIGDTKNTIEPPSVYGPVKKLPSYTPGQGS